MSLPGHLRALLPTRVKRNSPTELHGHSQDSPDASSFSVFPLRPLHEQHGGHSRERTGTLAEVSLAVDLR